MDSCRWAEGWQMLGVREGAPLNAGALAIDLPCERHPDRPALIHHHISAGRRVLSFAEVCEGAARFSSVLDELGIERGDRVLTLLEPLPELYYAVLGTVRAGAIAGPLFSAFGTEAIADRLADSSARVLVTHVQHLAKVRAATASLPSLEHILVVGEGELEGRERPLAPMLAAASPERSPAPTEADDPMLLHYSSGTTGKPKGVLHAHRAIVGHALTARVVLDLGPNDVYWCTADPGWVTGTSYGIFGPWSLGTCQVARVAGFTSEGWYETLAAERVSVWYTAPTALRMLMRDGAAMARAHDLSSLRHIASVGEPLNPEVIRWAAEALGRTVHDTWWQTETGCIQIANYPFQEVRPGSMGRPFAGATAAVLDPEGLEPLPPQREGLLALRPPWPSMFLGYRGREEALRERVRAGWYLTGDRAYTDADGYFWFVGRDDDVINTSGHLVGPFEIENALLAHACVSEAAAFAVPDEGAGEVVVVSVVLARGHEPSRELIRTLKTLVRRQVGPHAAPREVLFTEALPRTRSGKIMRRVARALYLGLPTGDLSALESD